MSSSLPVWLPTVLGILLVGLGLACFILEVKVVSYGIFTVLGGACLIAGLVLLLDEVPWLVVIPAIAGVMAIAGVLATMAYKVRLARPLGDAGELIGRIVPVTSGIGPEVGKVVVDGVYWSATSAKPIAPGAKARIVGATGLVLEVEPA